MQENKKKRFFAILGILVGFLTLGLSFSLINANLETIHRELDASILQLQWMINVYGIFIASSLVAMGRLGDIYGRKKFFLIGLAIFAIAMFGDGFSDSPNIIIGFQVLWGLSAAILLPISQALLVDIFPEQKKSTAMGIWACGSGFSLAIGPVIGGVILDFLSWRWIFLINLPFIIIGFVLIALFARESKIENEPRSIDWGGVFALKMAIAAFVLATVQSSTWKIPYTVSIYSFSVCAFLSLFFIEKKAKVPIIRHEFLRNRNFLYCCIAGFCTIGVFWSCSFLLPLFLQEQLHFTPLQSGVMLLGFALPIALLSPLSGHLYHKVTPKRLISLGFFLLILSGIMHLSLKPSAHTLFVAVAILFLGIGFSLIMTPTLTIAQSIISKQHSGVASGTFVTVQELGGGISLAITATVVRKQGIFFDGFHHGIWVILILSLIGIAATFAMQSNHIK